MNPMETRDAVPKRIETEQRQVKKELKDWESKRLEKELQDKHDSKTKLAIRTGSAQKLQPNQQTHIAPVSKII